MSVLDRLKLGGALVAVALVLVLLWQSSITAALTGWALCVYVLWRAAPAIRSDVRRVYRRAFPVNSWRF